MNRRWRQAAALAVLLGGPAGVASAADLPASVRTAADATSQKTAIDTYVKAQIDKIVKKDKAAGQARDELCRQVETSGPVAPSPSFQQVYVASVLAQINPLLADKSDKAVVTRLNGAIIIARLAIASKLLQLEPISQQLMADDSAAVALWGVKAGGALLPDQVRLDFNRKKQTLTKAIVTSAKTHESAGALIQTAYDALYLPDPAAGQSAFEPAAYAPSIDAINDVLAWRIDQYAKTAGTVPTTPQAERLPPVFFVRQIVSTAMTPQQRTAAVQNLLNMLSVCTQHLNALPSGDLRAQVLELVKNYAGALNVMFQQQTQPAVAIKFQPLTRLKDPVDVDAALKTIADCVSSVRALSAYKTIKDAPTVQ